MSKVARTHYVTASGAPLPRRPKKTALAAICKILQNAYDNPQTTTQFYAEVTCRNCQKALVGGVNTMDEATWWAWIATQGPDGCAADCDSNTFEGPVCRTCLCCAGCAGAYDYAQNRPGAPAPKNGKCPGCGN